jgi:hypothetical protein
MKKHGWPELLHDYIDAAQSRTFAFGAFDCALFCADWVTIATGVDHASDLRGYDSLLSASRIVFRYGNMKNMVTALLGREPAHAAFAQRGDIVLIRECTTTGTADLDGAPEGLGICIGLHSAFPRAEGLITIRTLEAAAAWKVG